MNRSTPRKSLVAALVVTLVASLAPAALAVDDSTPITINGGGWGHHIGMPQLGARGQADEGWTYQQILAYWYDGTVVGQVADSSKPVPDPILVGNTVTRSSIEFSAVNGPVEVCVNGETLGSCSLSAEVGETWTISYSSSQCTLKEDSSTVYGPGSCDITVEWGDQPNTRVDVPTVDKTFPRGRLVVKGASGGFHLSAELTLEDYLYGIAEISPNWHPEALKAQIVASRTFASWRASTYGLRSDCNCHLRWTSSDQVYGGWHHLSEGSGDYGDAWRSAVEATTGEVVYPEGSDRLAETYYFSNSGGASENVSDMWGSDQSRYPYLVSRPDSWSEIFANPDCTISRVRWCRTRSAGEIVSALGLSEASYDLISIEIVSTYESGSPSDILFRFRHGNGTIVEQHHTGRSVKSKLGLTSHFVYSFDGVGTGGEPERFAGADRYLTAVEASEATFPDGAPVVYIGTGLNYPDALSGGVAAAVEGGPVLLTKKSAIPQPTVDEIRRLNPSKIVILGGTGVVATNVESFLGSLAPNVVRRAGPTRFETAVEVSKGVFTGPVSTVYVTGGFSFTDALVAGPAAVRDGGPLLLTHYNFVPSALADELTRLQPDKIVIVGGTGAVPLSIENALGAYATTVTRISGSDRYVTGANVSNTFPAETETVYIAVGTNYPDALAGGAIAGQDLGPMLLVETSSIPASVKAELTRIGPSRIVILGGTGVVSTAVEDQLASYIK